MATYGLSSRSARQRRRAALAFAHFREFLADEPQQAEMASSTIRFSMS
jgi:hypothetical protein